MRSAWRSPSGVARVGRAALVTLAGLWTLVVLAPSPQAQQESTEALGTRSGDLVSVFGGTIHVPAHTEQQGSVVSIGGTVKIEGIVTEDVVVILGTLELSGSVQGDVVTVFGEQRLRRAHIDGDVVNVLGSLQLQDARISGSLVNILGSLERDAASLMEEVVDLSLRSWFPNLGLLIFWFRLFGKFLAFVFLLLLVAMVPERIQLIAEHARAHYGLALLVGLLGYIGMLLVVGVLSLTVVGIPVALLGFWVLKWLGIAGIFCALSQGIGRRLGRELSLLGGVLLTFGLYTFVLLTPSLMGIPGLLILICLSFLRFLLLDAPALGLIILTRAGGRAFRSGSMATAVAAPLAPASSTGGTGSPSVPPLDDSKQRPQ